jgi:hypothetical protein
LAVGPAGFVVRFPFIVWRPAIKTDGTLSLSFPFHRPANPCRSSESSRHPEFISVLLLIPPLLRIAGFFFVFLFFFILFLDVYPGITGPLCLPSVFQRQPFTLFSEIQLNLFLVLLEESLTFIFSFFGSRSG